MGRLEGKAANGKGSLNEQFVDAEGRAGNRSLAETDQEHAVKEGGGFTFYSTYNVQGAEEAWYVRNDGRDIHFDSIEVSTAASGVVTIMRQTAGTAAGTVMEGRNMKAGQAILGDVTAFGSASVTGSVDGDDIMAHDIGTSTPHTFKLHGYLLPKGQAIFVRFATTGVGHITGIAHTE